MYSSQVRQNSRKDFKSFIDFLANKAPFTFVRFSDGEMEVIRNQPFRIGNGKVSWRKGDFSYRYPDFDEKEFSPERDFRLRDELIESAIYLHPQYFKGIPASHNSARADQNLMIDLNGHSITNLTFSDLFINQNFKKFRNHAVPLFQSFSDVFVLGNFRAKPELLNSNWRLIPVEDNFFPNFERVKEEKLRELSALPKDALVLASASSLTNIIGKRLHEVRKDLTYFDIGTSMHDLMGMEMGIREYHSVLLPNNLSGMKSKLNLYRRRNFWLKW
jgi:hypothetical protein